jgi:glucosamine-6-phosphate deaminase
VRIVRADTPREFACAAADFTARHLHDEPRLALALPTGSTPLGLYAELVKRSRAGALSFAQARIFNLDEYCGLPRTDPHSYAAFLDRHLIAPLSVAPAKVRLLRGDAADLEAECLDYDAALVACDGIDLCVLGLGTNGHIAFNEPGSSWTQRTHIVHLSRSIRADHARQATSGWEIPTRGITLGIQNLLEARHVLLLIAGAHKRAAITALYRGIEDLDWPVTCLLKHPSVTVIELCGPENSP